LWKKKKKLAETISATCQYERGFFVIANNGAHVRKSVQYVASLLLAAQQEATKFNLSEVQAWNPTPTTAQAAKVAYPGVAAVIDRESQSIASLKWYSSGSPLDEVEWIGNEKYGWC
jgi:hypothetical protein